MTNLSFQDLTLIFPKVKHRPQSFFPILLGAKKIVATATARMGMVPLFYIKDG